MTVGEMTITGKRAALDRDPRVRAARERAEKAEAESARLAPLVAAAALANHRREIEATRRASTGATAPFFASKSAAYDALAAVGETVRKADPTLTREQAMDRAYMENPDLVAAYRDAPDDAPERVERAAAPALPGSEYVSKIDRLVDEHLQRTGSSRDAAITAVLASPEGAQLRLAHRAANGWI